MMNKSQFLKGFAVKTKTVKVDGGEVEIAELTLEQRGKLHGAAKGDIVRGQALIVCMGCTMFEDSDIDDVLALSGDIVSDLADAILAFSGLTESDAEKN